MDFLRLYLGEIASLVLLIVVLFGSGLIAKRAGANPIVVKTVRNLCLALAIGAFAASVTYSFITNGTPRGRIDRSAADQDQKAFEQRHSGQNK